MHVPEPLQIEARVVVVLLFEQVCGAQVPVQYWQRPVPSHLPVVPHEVGTVAAQSLTCGVSAETTAHVPSGLPVKILAHAEHFEAHAFSQHTPSTHLPVAHSVPVVQPWPWDRATQVLLALQTGALAGQSVARQQLGSAEGMQALPQAR
jgi:hypothetical protein